MSELILSVVAGSDRLVGFGDTFGSGGDAVFVVTFVTLCVALSLFAVGSWFWFRRLFRPDCSLDGVLVSDLISSVGAGSDHRADCASGSDRGADVMFVVMFVIFVLGVLGPRCRSLCPRRGLRRRLVWRRVGGSPGWSGCRACGRCRGLGVWSECDRSGWCSCCLRSPSSASCSCSLSWTPAKRSAVFVSSSFNWLSEICGGGSWLVLIPGCRGVVSFCSA